MFLPPELLGCRRTTCSRVSLIVFSSSSSDRPASAIAPVLLSVRTLTSPVCLCVCSGGSNGAGSRQRRHRHYSSFRVVVAKHPNTTTPDEFTETPSTSQPEASSGAGPTLRLGSGFVRTATKLLGQQQSLFWFRLNTFSCSPPGRATPPHTAARAPAA